MRAAAKVGDVEKANNIKRKLPMFMFMCGHIDDHAYEGKSCFIEKGKVGSWRNQQHVHPNGLVMLDFDDHDFDYKVWWFEKGVTLIDKAHILLAHLTPKWGLRLVCIADEKVGNLADNQEAISKLIGLEYDGACKDASRGSFICTNNDILYQDNKIFNYENHEFDKKYGDSYRTGDSRNTSAVRPHNVRSNGTNDGGSPENVGCSQSQAQGTTGYDKVTLEKDEEGNYCFAGVPYASIQDALWNAYGGKPRVGTRHTNVLSMAHRLRYICDNNKDNILAVIDGCGLPQDEVEQIVDSVIAKPMAPYIPTKIRDVIEGVFKQLSLKSPFRGNVPSAVGGADQVAAISPIDYMYWWNRLRPTICDGLSDAVQFLPDEIKMGGVLAAGAMFGTYLTRIHFLHYDGEMRRMSFLVYIEGLPASGKSFLDTMNKLIMEPMKVADDLGRKMEEKYKEDLKMRQASTKNQKEQAMEIPKACIRKVPTNTSNSQLFTRLQNAKETINGETVYLHLFTCESEIASMNKVGSAAWIAKNDIECKAFQNEFTGVDYKNMDSSNASDVEVNWNIVATGTPDAFRKKFRATDALTGLTTRVALFPMPERWFGMIEKRTCKNRDFAAESRLRSWGYRLDKLHGEAICPKLVDVAYDWCAEMAKEAGANNDRIADFFRKRVPFYIVRYGIVHNILRDLEYVEKLMKDNKPLKLRINKQDIDFALTIGDFIYMMQIRMFGQQTLEALENGTKDFVPHERKSAFDELYKSLPNQFDTATLAKAYKIEQAAASSHIKRLKARGLIKSIKHGVFKKIIY